MLGLLKSRLLAWTVLAAILGAIVLGLYVRTLQGKIVELRASQSLLKAELAITQAKIARDSQALAEAHREIVQTREKFNQKQVELQEALSDDENKTWGRAAVPDGIIRLFQ